jgi:hypothetical protein
MARDLTTLSAVKKMIGGEANTTTTYDTILSSLITQSSEMLHREARREFVGPAAAAVRSFNVDRDTLRERELLVGDLKTMSDVAYVKLYRRDGTPGTLIETSDLSLIVALPEVKEDWQPYYSLLFLPHVATSAALELGARVEINAKWGFPAIPDDIAYLACKQASIWFERDYARNTTTAPTRYDRYDLDIGVRFAIRRYRLPSL